MTNSNVLYIELETALAEGRAFDALVSGKYTDMMGREIEFKVGELADFVANTQAAIDATTTESGEVVGLPIDAMNHDHGNAAGWIVAIELANDIVRVVPKWTEIGRELIGKGIQRFFSATVDVANKVILGGTLTNWPATRDKAGRIQLRPIELSESLCEIIKADGSQEVINMAKVEEKKPETKEPDVKDENVTNVTNVNFDLAELQANITQAVLAGIQEKTEEDAEGDDVLDDIVDLTHARELLGGEIETALRGEYTRIQANAGNLLKSMMAEIKKDQHIAEFSQRVVTGTDKRPYGLPVGQEEVETFLLSLNDQQREAAESILTRVHEQDLIQFGAVGHGKRLQGVATFPVEFGPSLTSWTDDGGSIEEYFAINSDELGDMAQYNLDDYKEND